MTTRPNSTPVTVLGLGSMGAALAGALVDAGHPTSVWNRNPTRAEPLVARGARRATTAADAVTANDLVIVCLLDTGAVHDVLDPLVADLAGRTVVNLTSSSPEDARALADWAGSHGIRYLDGAVLVPTPLVGTPATLVLYSGPAQVFAEHEPVLRSLGGTAGLLGDDPGLAAVHDLGMLDVFFAGMVSFLHAAALVGADGVPATAFLPYAERIVAILPDTLRGLARDVDAGSYPGDEDNLAMETAAIEHIVEASRTRGVDPAFPDVMRRLARAAVEEGHGADGFGRVVDRLRPRVA